MSAQNPRELQAAWLARDPSLSNNAQSSMSPSVNASGGTTSSAKKSSFSDGVLPFTIYLQSGKWETSPSLRLLINPHDINYGSTQVMTTSYGRDAHIVTLWGPAQGTLTGNGVSAAFINDGYGLAGSSSGNARKDTLGYANVMSFLALMRSNGYHHMISGSDTAAPKKEVAPEGEGNTQSPRVVQSGEGEIATFQDTPSHMSGFVGGERNRVIQVMDNIVINYDNTSYIGSFASFSLEASGENPFRFNFTFEFVISGLLGDTLSGHINDGSNKKIGIRIGKQGTSFAYTIGVDKSKLTSIQVYTTDDGPSEASGANGQDLTSNYELPSVRATGVVNVPQYLEATVEAAAKKYKMDVNLLKGLIMQESGWDPTAQSATGALGIAQMLPAAATEMKLKVKDGATPDTSPLDDERLNPQKAIYACAGYYTKYRDKYGLTDELALTAYNWGIGNTLSHIKANGGQGNIKLIKKIPPSKIPVKDGSGNIIGYNDSLEHREYAPKILHNTKAYSEKGN